jgi:hypothetical protein
LALPLEQFQWASFFYFHTWIQNTSTIFTLIPPFLVPTPLPLVPTQEKIYFFLYCASFFKILIVQGGFTLVHRVCIYRAFIQLPHPLCYLLIVP